MKADFSRLRFDPAKHYHGVLEQQGRVSLDADWNEEVFTRLYLRRQEVIDVVGQSGVPKPGTAFAIGPPAANRPFYDFSIAGGAGAAGNFYVGGILCRQEQSVSYLSQPDFPDPPAIDPPPRGQQLTALIYLETWTRLITALEDDAIREIALGGPDTTVRMKNIAQVKVLLVSGDDANCAAAGNLLPPLGRGTLTTLQPPPVQPPDPCRLPDPNAFTGTENHFYRVEIHDPGDVLGDAANGAFRIALAQDANAGASSIVLSSALNATQSAAAIRSRVVTVADADGRTETVPIATVSGDGLTINLARQLRTPFQTARTATVAGGVARFKWSRDNAAFAVRVSDVSPDRRTLTLSSLGRDQATALREGDLVEISDDGSELRDGHGHLTYLSATPDPDLFQVVLADAIPAAIAPLTSPPTPVSTRNVILRRWDGAGLASNAYDDAGTPDMNLGDGVHLQFGGFDLQAGDYWQFVARTLDGSVEQLVNATPTGVLRLRAPLAVVTWTNPQTSPPSPIAFALVEDCRKPFRPLTEAIFEDPGIHVTGVFSRSANNQAFPLRNDTDVSFSNLLGGIDVVCDGTIDAITITRPTCSVSIELPFIFGNFANALYQALIVGATVSGGGNLISWRPTQPAQALLAGLPAPPAGDRGLLARLHLAGNFIWDAKRPGVFLDGDAFGVRRRGGVDVRLPSGDKRSGGDFNLWFWLTPPQAVVPFTFVASATVPPILRAEGLTERVADLILTGTGGQPTAAGQNVPVVNLTVFLNTNLTSPLLPVTAAAGLSDVALIIDEPTSLNISQQATVPPAIPGVGGAGLNYAGGAVPNIFLGRKASPSSVVFTGIPLDPPGPGATRTLRITNLRANASQIGGGSTAPGQVIALAVFAGTAPPPLNNPQQTVGVVQSGTIANVTLVNGQPGPFTFFGPLGINQATVTNPQNNEAVTNVLLNFRETFASSFKVRSTGVGALGADRSGEESGFDNNGAGALPVTTGAALLPIGQATNGTRFRAVFSNVPGRMRIFVTTRDIPPEGVSPANPNVPPVNAAMVTGDSNGAGGNPFITGIGKSNNVPFVEVPIVNGTGVATWEWVSTSPAALNQLQSVSMGVILAIPGQVITIASANVHLSIAPISNVADSTSGAPVPRFVDAGVDRVLFNANTILVGGGGGVIVRPDVGPIRPPFEPIRRLR